MKECNLSIITVTIKWTALHGHYIVDLNTVNILEIWEHDHIPDCTCKKFCNKKL